MQTQSGFNATTFIPQYIYQYYGIAHSGDRPVLGEGDVWVPAMWYSSLILTVLATLVVLLIKTWFGPSRLALGPRSPSFQVIISQPIAQK